MSDFDRKEVFDSLKLQAEQDYQENVNAINRLFPEFQHPGRAHGIALNGAEPGEMVEVRLGKKSGKSGRNGPRAKKCTECEHKTPVVDQVMIDDDNGGERMVCSRCKGEKDL